MARPHASLVLLVCACTARDPVAAPEAAQEPEATQDVHWATIGEPTAKDDPAPPQIDTPGDVATPPMQRCEFTTRVPDLNEVTTLGGSPAEMLRWLAGEHKEALAWQDQNGEFSAAPESAELTIVVDPIPGAIRLFVSNPEDPSAGSCEEAGSSGDISTTFDRLEFDVHLRVSTSDGELNESLDTTLVANASDFASGWIQLPIDALGDVPGDATAAYLRFGISPFGDVGQLYFWRGDVSYVERSTTPLPQSVIARFPVETFCGPTVVPFSPSDTIRGVSMQAAVERLNALGPVKLGDVDAHLSWTFATTDGQGCADLGSPSRMGSVWGFRAHVAVSSSEQQIDGNFDVSVYGAAFDGSMGEPSAGTNIEISDITTAAAAARDFGIQAPLDFTPYQKGRLGFRTELQGDLLTGSLGAWGVDPVGVTCDSSGTACGTYGGETPLYSVGWSVHRR